ncbi:MAG: RES family NAD+ phosphorylase [Betaproteobacteria bacterium]|nr:RES family NAD+ phosphorylase [Betaproteobacteria bacterium]
MIHDVDLLDRLSSFAAIKFNGEVFRATRKSLDPLTPSVNGGRWVPKGGVSVLYTSLTREGALAELSFHWSQFNPLPSKPANLHQMALTTQRTLRLLKADLDSLSVDWTEYPRINYVRTQQIGAAIAFLGCDGLIAPSARWSTENMMIFTENHDINENDLRLIRTEEVEWIAWAKQNGFIA